MFSRISSFLQSLDSLPRLRDGVYYIENNETRKLLYFDSNDFTGDAAGLSSDTHEWSEFCVKRIERNKYTITSASLGKGIAVCKDSDYPIIAENPVILHLIFDHSRYCRISNRAETRYFAVKKIQGRNTLVLRSKRGKNTLWSFERCGRLPMPVNQWDPLPKPRRARIGGGGGGGSRQGGDSTYSTTGGVPETIENSTQGGGSGSGSRQGGDSTTGRGPEKIEKSTQGGGGSSGRGGKTDGGNMAGGGGGSGGRSMTRGGGGGGGGGESSGSKKDGGRKTIEEPGEGDSVGTRRRRRSEMGNKGKLAGGSGGKSGNRTSNSSYQSNGSRFFEKLAEAANRRKELEAKKVPRRQVLATQQQILIDVINNPLNQQDATSQRLMTILRKILNHLVLGPDLPVPNSTHSDSEETLPGTDTYDGGSAAPGYSE